MITRYAHNGLDMEIDSLGGWVKFDDYHRMGLELGGQVRMLERRVEELKRRIGPGSESRPTEDE